MIEKLNMDTSISKIFITELYCCKNLSSDKTTNYEIVLIFILQQTIINFNFQMAVIKDNF